MTTSQSCLVVRCIRNHTADIDRRFMLIKPDHIIRVFRRLEDQGRALPEAALEAYAKRHARIVNWYQGYCVGLISKCNNCKDWSSLKDLLNEISTSSSIIALNVATLLYTRPAAPLVSNEYIQLYKTSIDLVAMATRLYRKSS